MVDRLNRYWSFDSYSEDFVSRAENIYKAGKMVQIVMLCIIEFCIYITFFKPLFNQNNVFLLDSTIFIDSMVLSTVVLFLQYYFYYIVIAIVFGYDAIYLSLCIDLTIQIRTLKYKLKEVFNSRNNTISDITICVNHHFFLLS